MTASIIERIKSRHPELTDKTVGVVGMLGKAETVDPESRNLWVVANTDGIDCDEEVVIPAGADTSYFDANKAIFVDHCYSLHDTVGTARKIVRSFVGVRQTGWKVHAHVYQLSNNRLGDDILTIAKSGTIGVSVGFEPMDWGRPTPDEAKSYASGGKSPESIVRKWRWVELSFTAMPCNVSCRSQESRVLEGNAASIDSLLTKGLIHKSSAEALGFRVKPMKIKAVCRVA